MQLLSQDGLSVMPYTGARILVNQVTTRYAICVYTPAGVLESVAEYDSKKTAKAVLNEIKHHAANGKDCYELPLDI